MQVNYTNSSNNSTKKERKNTDNEVIPFEKSECFSLISDTLESAFNAMKPRIEYESSNSMLQIFVTAPAGTANAIIMDKKAIVEDWNTLCLNLTAVSKTAYEACISEGYNIGCAVMLLSDANPDNVLFAAMNGDVFTNEFSE